MKTKNEENRRTYLFENAFQETSGRGSLAFIGGDAKGLGGKGANIELLRRGGFTVPKTFNSVESDSESRIGGFGKGKKLSYIVRSSSDSEDSNFSTHAGEFRSIRDVDLGSIKNAVRGVLSSYNGNGKNAVIQPDISDIMLCSGVAYSNIDGKIHVAMGGGGQVHQIVEGVPAETEIEYSNGRYSINGFYVPEKAHMESLVKGVLEAEIYFDTPLDIEFCFVGGIKKPVFLQARALPNPNRISVKEHEIRKALEELKALKAIGVDEMIFGIGNDREILGDDRATKLSASLFSYIFSGDGISKLGAFQLGRNELGYEIGLEISPSTLMIGGSVYYNFAGAALQFRPKGIGLDELVRVINESYMPEVRKNPELLNYPELGLFIQFPEDAIKAGLDPKPYENLNKGIIESMKSVEMPIEAPKRVIVEKPASLEDACKAMVDMADSIRVGSAKDYVKAARYAFFSMEYLRNELEILKGNDRASFDTLAGLFGIGNGDTSKLRDALCYDKSIASFVCPKVDEYKYQGSFEISLDRGYAQDRHEEKLGMDIPVKRIADAVDNVRRMLEYREKVKFFLFRDYDCLKQTCGHIVRISEFKDDIYYMDFKELSLLDAAPILARNSIETGKTAKGLFKDAIFGAGEKEYNAGTDETKIVFGSLDDGNYAFSINVEAVFIKSVDQTINVPKEAKIVVVQDNIRPGSHLFTLLSDYGIPVITMARRYMEDIDKHNAKILSITNEGGKIGFGYN